MILLEIDFYVAFIVVVLSCFSKKKNSKIISFFFSFFTSYQHFSGRFNEGNLYARNILLNLINYSIKKIPHKLKDDSRVNLK